MATPVLVLMSSYLLAALLVINLGAWPKATSAKRVYPTRPPPNSDMNVASEPSMDLNAIEIQSEPIKPGRLPDHDGGGVKWSQDKNSSAVAAEAGSNNGGGFGVHGTVGSGRGFGSVGASVNVENDSDTGASNPGFGTPGIINLPAPSFDVPSFNIPNVGFGVGFGGGAGMGMGGNGVGAGSGNGLGAGSGGPGVIGIGQGSGTGVGTGSGGVGFGAGIGWGVGIGGSGGNGVNLPIGINVPSVNPPQQETNTPGGGNPSTGSTGGNNGGNDDSGKSDDGSAAPAPAAAERDESSIPNCPSNNSPEPNFASGLRCEPLNCAHGECSAITLYFNYNPSSSSSSSSTATSKEDRQSKNDIHKSVTPISDEVVDQMRMDNMDGDKFKMNHSQHSSQRSTNSTHD